VEGRGNEAIGHDGDRERETGEGRREPDGRRERGRQKSERGERKRS